MEYLYKSINTNVITFLAVSHLALQKQSKDRFGLEGDEEATMLEESVSPKKYALPTHTHTHTHKDASTT